MSNELKQTGLITNSIDCESNIAFYYNWFSKASGKNKIFAEKINFQELILYVFSHFCNYDLNLVTN